MSIHSSRPSLRRAGSEESNGSIDSHPSRTLLFGEIEVPSSPSLSGTSTLRSYRSNSSVCNLVLSSSTTFLRFWHAENVRNTFLSHIDTETLESMRLVCHDFKSRAAPFLFENVQVNFKPRAFTRTGNLVALDRIGHHVKTFTFKMSHSPETFLPPLLDPVPGEQRSFVYTPRVRTTKSKEERQPKYGTWEITELVIQQYPPVFHAATNISSFIRAFRSMPNLRHLKISCPGQEETHRYRRSAVDYALISLRIAIERACLPLLDTLSLLSVHPAALHDLQPLCGLGSTPNSGRRWSQIQNLSIEMSSFPFDMPSRTEHLRILHSYLRFFSASLTRLTFKWLESKGPSPLSLDSEQILSMDAGPPSPRPSGSPTRPRTPKPLRFPQLQYMRLENAVMDSFQISAFIQNHRHMLQEFIFEDIKLRSGDWDDALSPLHRMAAKRSWREPSAVKCPTLLFGEFSLGDFELGEYMDVPCVLSPVDVIPEPMIMDTLEPQPEPAPKGLSKWLPKRKTRRPSRSRRSPNVLQKESRPQREWSGTKHLKDALRTGVFSWR